MKHPIRRRLMYLGFQGLRGLGRILPLPLARSIGRGVGRLAYWLLVADRRLKVGHLAYALGPTQTAAAREQIAQSVFVNLGQNAMEWLVLPRLSSVQLQELVSSEGIEHLRQAIAKGNGAIVVTAHFGNWEFISPYLRTLGFEGGVLARRLRYPEYESFLIDLRGARGIPTYTRGSLKDVAKVLRANQIIGLLPDQDIDSLDGVFVSFFGHPAYTPVGPAALSLMTGAPIVPCFMIREGTRFRLVVEPPVTSPTTIDRTQAVTELTQAWSAVVESYIRRYPDHWVWMHRRWKTKPPMTNQQHAIMNTEHTPPPITGRSAMLAACCLLLATMTSGCGKPRRSVATPPPTMSSETDQQMSGFALTGYQSDGSKRWELEGEGASIDRDIVTIRRPDAIGYDVDRTAYLTASVAQVNQTTRAVRMEHDVTIHTSDGLWFTTPILHWVPDQEQMATDLPVRFETDHMLLRGRGFTGQTQLKHATVLTDIEMVLNPSEQDLPVGGAKQVTITCDGPLSFDYQRNIATFEQNVHVHDPNGELFSDTLVAHMDRTTHTIRYAEATGRVKIYQHQNTALSERAIYEPAIGKITLVGKPSLLVYPSSSDASIAQMPLTESPE